MVDLIISLLQTEIEREAAITRKMLALVPSDKYDWKPHQKSMSFKQLAVHIAEIPAWVDMAINKEVLDFAAGDYKPSVVNNQEDLLALFEKSLEEGNEALHGTTDEFILKGTWTMKAGDHIIMTLSKYETIRHAISQTIHHRAQLGVYLRLNDILLPVTYGASADDKGGF